MKVRRHTNFAGGLVVVAIAAIVLLRSLAVIPDGLYDLFLRAWPALLVLAGLSVLLGPRLPLGSGLALLVSAGLVVGVAFVAYSSRAEQERTDYTETIRQQLGENVTLLRVQVRTLATDVELVRLLNSSGEVSGEFIGSEESVVSVEYNEDDVATAGAITATLEVREEQTSAFPRLEAVGRGMLRLELPADLPMDVEFVGDDGIVILNMSDLSLERLNVNLEHGEAVVTLPAYDPLLSAETDPLGTLAVYNGDITLRVPEPVATRLELDRGRSDLLPQFDDTVYYYLQNDVLEARAIDDADFVMHYAVTAPRGQIRVEQIPAV